MQESFAERPVTPRLKRENSHTIRMQSSSPVEGLLHVDDEGKLRPMEATQRVVAEWVLRLSP